MLSLPVGQRLTLGKESDFCFINLFSTSNATMQLLLASATTAEVSTTVAVAGANCLEQIWSVYKLNPVGKRRSGTTFWCKMSGALPIDVIGFDIWAKHGTAHQLPQHYFKIP